MSHLTDEQLKKMKELADEAADRFDKIKNRGSEDHSIFTSDQLNETLQHLSQK